MKTFSKLVLILIALTPITGCELWDSVTLQEDDKEEIVDAIEGVETAVREEGQATRDEGNQTQALLSEIAGSAPDGGTEPVHPPGTPGSGICGGDSLWKPTSEGDGNLVVLANSGSNPSFLSVNGEQGRFVGRTNGNRPTFRFSKPGCGYGTNVQVVSDDGTCTVPNGCNRDAL